ncbi:MAG: hypothetical protein R2684_15850 [Pyrinomonadaceae bacterium]
MSTVKQNEEKWLACHLDKGMFSDEVAVTYPHTGQFKKSVFVPKTSVQGDIGQRGQVLVKIVRAGDGRVMAVLPSSQRDVVVIAETDVT